MKNPKRQIVISNGKNRPLYIYSYTKGHYYPVADCSFGVNKQKAAFFSYAETVDIIDFLNGMFSGDFHIFTRLPESSQYQKDYPETIHPPIKDIL